MDSTSGYRIAAATAALLISACGGQEAPDRKSGQGATATVSAGTLSHRESFILRIDFHEAVARLDAASERRDSQFFLDQWSQVDVGDNLDMSVASRNRLALTVRLAELVQTYAPERADEAQRYLIDLSTSAYPFHREAAARAMRESKGRDAVEALFARAIDSDLTVSSTALQSLHWKYDSAAMGDASDATVEDAELIARNIEKLCADPRLPKTNIALCRTVQGANR